MSNTRIITAFSTRGKAFQKIESAATTWGELKPQLEAEGYDLSTLLATESINRHDLAHKDAVLPEGAFTVFLRPKDTKSGTEGFEEATTKEIRTFIRENKEVPGFMDHMNAGGNWTRTKSPVLRERIASWNAPAIKTIKADSATPKVEASTDCPIDSIKCALTSLADAKANNEDTYVDELLDTAIGNLNEAVEELDVESPEAIAQREADEAEAARKEAEAVEAKQAAKDAKDLMKGF